MSLLDKMKGVRYRARIFDNGIYLKTIETPDVGQRDITSLVKAKKFGIFGEEVKIKFIINPKIRPKLFGGYIQEIDYDVRDAMQLADLFDLMPDYVCELEDTFKQNIKTFEEAKNDPGIESLTEPTPASVPEGGAETKESDKKVVSPTMPKKPGIIKGSAKIASCLLALREAIEDKDRRKIISDCLELCKDHPTMFYLLPHEFKIDQEVRAICAQTVIGRTGVIPSYYTAQSNAPIAEKVLQRPQIKTGWEQVVLILGVIIGFLILAALIFKASGMI